MSKTIISKLARSAQRLLLSVSIFTAIIVAFLSLFIPQNIVAQFQSPAIEADAWGRVMIGRNDPNDNSLTQHQLTLGGGPDGLWCIWGSGSKSFNIGRTTGNVVTAQTNSNYTGQTGGRYMFYIDSNMNIGIDRWLNAISYKLDVGGDVAAWGVVLHSDRRYKRDIKPLDNIDRLFKLNSVQYKPSSEALQEQLELYIQNAIANKDPNYDAVVASYKAKIAETDTDTSTNFGFIAQELRELYPNLVSEDRQGFLSVNYIGLIPVLVDAIKTQQTQINELNSKVSELNGGSFVKSNTTSPTAKVFAESKYAENSPQLYQNNPNPFDTQTEIKYYIPTVAINATICVYDMVGAEVLKMEIRGRESGSITIDANQLRAGMYMYALLVDGKEIDVKRMILTGK